MNIIEALQDKNNRLRISDGGRWLCGDGEDGWIVYERKPYAKKTMIICETKSESVAIAALLSRVDDNDEQ